MNLNREEVILKTIRDAHKSEFGLTAVKVEMEAGLGRSSTRHVERNRNGNCTHCRRGRTPCVCCNESDRRGQHPCEWCTDRNPDCSDCHGTGWYDCDDCEGTGTFECNYCRGAYHSDTKSRNWSNNTECQDFLLEYLSQFGLARRKRRTDDVASHYGKWIPKLPLVFSYLYSDGGDTEWTFTLLIKDETKAFLLRECVNAFNALAAAIRVDGGLPEINVERAGMHMSLLNSPNGEYEYSNTNADDRRFENYRKSMILLLPAVYLLGASSHVTRSLSPRTPAVSSNDKYSAIYYQGGALEFRVFDTCYGDPEQILDNLVTMCRTLKYWSLKYKRNYLNKVTTKVRFGNDNGRELERLYLTIEHIDLLNRGLKLIKPPYQTITDIKKQRNFNVSKRTLGGKMKDLLKQVEQEYKEYERQFSWEIVMREHNYIERELQLMRNNPEAQVSSAAIRKIKVRAKKMAKEDSYVRDKKECEQFIKEKVDYHQRNSGSWVLQAETA